MIQPLETKILIKPEPVEEKRNGIIQPPKKTRTGEVLAVGEQVDGIAAGSRIEYYANSVVEVDGNHLLDDYENKVLFIY